MIPSLTRAEIQGGRAWLHPAISTLILFPCLEPVHGSAPDIAGKNIANPLAPSCTAGTILEYLSYREFSEKVDQAVEQVINENLLTKDMGSELSTSEAGGALVDVLRKLLK